MDAVTGYLQGPPPPGTTGGPYYRYPTPASTPNPLQRLWNLLSGADNPPDSGPTVHPPQSSYGLFGVLGDPLTGGIVTDPGGTIAQDAANLAGVVTNPSNIGKDLLVGAGAIGLLIVLAKVL